jgi:putative Mn2+ efflux pump MntP
MDFISIFIIALALSMDAFAVAVTNGIIISRIQIRHYMRIAFFFGLFQGVMPVIGWAAGSHFRDAIQPIDHWIAFGLLTAVGGKMIYEALTVSEIGQESKTNCLHFPTLLLMSLATSIDALAAGISFAVLDVYIVKPALIIGGVTVAMSVLGIKIGDTVGHLFENYIEIVGGIMLFGIGLKILIEHLIRGC